MENMLIPQQVLLVMALIAFAAGVITLIGGIVILAVRVSSKGKDSLTNQASQVAQKSLAEDFSGMMVNASTMMESMNQLVKTATGIGVFLCCLGLTLMAAASILLYLLNSAV